MFNLPSPIYHSPPGISAAGLIAGYTRRRAGRDHEKEPVAGTVFPRRALLHTCLSAGSFGYHSIWILLYSIRGLISIAIGRYSCIFFGPQSRGGGWPAAEQREAPVTRRRHSREGGNPGGASAAAEEPGDPPTRREAVQEFSPNGAIVNSQGREPLG